MDASVLRIPIWREGRVALEHAALRRDPVLEGEGVPPGNGMPVLLIPGFLAGDPTLATMARWLKRMGYRPCRARMRINVDCTTRAVERLEAEAEELAARHGRKVAIVGQSRGGALARILAVRRPDLIEGIVTLGSPLLDHFRIHPLVRAQVLGLGLLGTLGVPGLFSHACGYGECCAESREHGLAPFPKKVGFVSIYSRSDGIVDWRSCLDPCAEHVEVHASHIGMAVSAPVFRAVGEALGALVAAQRRKAAPRRRAAAA
jgi:pimeloyl-ACP methyl ester carboxylesterase